MEGRSYVPQERGQSSRSPLHTAAYSGNLLQVIVLLQRGSQTDTPSRLPSDNGRRALHLATLGGHLDVVNELLNRGANPNAYDRQGFRPLHIAAQQGAVDIVQRLRKAKANLDAQTRAGCQAVHLAAGNGHVCILRLLQEYHCNLAAPDSSSATPLHHAAGQGRQEAVRWLIRAGVSLTVKDEKNMSAAERAKRNNHHAIYLDLTAAAKIYATKHATGMRYRSQPNLRQVHQRPVVDIHLPEISDVHQESPTSPHLYRSFTHPFILHKLPGTTPPITTPIVRSDIPAESSATPSPQNTSLQFMESARLPYLLPLHKAQKSATESSLPQLLPTKSPPQQSIALKAVQTPPSPHAAFSHEEQTQKSPSQGKTSPGINEGSYGFQDSSLHSSNPSSPFISLSPSHSPDVYPASPDIPYSGTASLSSPDLSPPHTALPCTSPLLPRDEGKPAKKGEKKGANLKLSRIFNWKLNPKSKAMKSDVIQNAEDVEEEIAKDGCSLGQGELNHPGQSPPQEAAFLDLQVQAAPRPFKEGPDVYPCTSNPRGIVTILNNKSFHDRPDLTRYGSECDTKNLEDMFQKMGYEVRTRSDLTRQATLDWFLEVSKFPMLQSVSCLFVFILSHGEGKNIFSTYDNETVSMDEVQSCFLNQSCPNLRGKPKVFFSHFCRGNDEETQSQYSTDAKREAYKDMICLYSSTEGFQALRHQRLGTPSVRALCLTLARFAHSKHFRDIIQEFQKLYEKMEGATSPEVQDFKFKKEFYLNPTGKSK